MEETISKMSKNLANFCNNLQSTSQAFKQSLDRRPIPLDSASTTFMRSLNGRVSTLTADLNLMDSMSFATVSFEELLGHCDQLYQQNHSQLLHLHAHLQSFGYISSSDVIDDVEEEFMAQSNNSPEPDAKFLSSYHGNTSHRLEDDPLFDEPPSLQNLGLSEICLATLASEGDEKKDVLDTPPKLRSSEVHSQDTVGGEVNYGSNICGEALKMIFVSDDDYESLPSYMKSLAPWKDLLSAVAKMNSFLSKKGNSQQSNFFHPEELESMGLGQKGRSYLLLLVRMNRLVVEIKSGLITYRVL
ncbi:hypothetical protein RND81_04G051200 [Saponaria officinalis]|uniref:Spindle and kinetochore-associated protein 3 n=1 Tax=Saponaria officinalis TaxID=3572 RepID=A0AAW1LJ29_SAPOF